MRFLYKNYWQLVGKRAVSIAKVPANGSHVHFEIWFAVVKLGVNLKPTPLFAPESNSILITPGLVTVTLPALKYLPTSAFAAASIDSASPPDAKSVALGKRLY